jgi:hypothetical protein
MNTTKYTEEGYQAYMDGVPIDRTPYNCKDDEEEEVRFWEWRRGWQRAEDVQLYKVLPTY